MPRLPLGAASNVFRARVQPSIVTSEVMAMMILVTAALSSA